MSYKKELITAQVLAEALDLSVETVWRYTRENKIPYIVIGSKNYRYDLDDVMRSLTEPRVGGRSIRKKKSTRNLLSGLSVITGRTGLLFEILDGVLIKEPSPSVIHQRVSRRLQRMLEDYFWKLDPEGEIFNAPLDVTFHDTSIVQPDLFYVPVNKSLS